MGRLSSLEDLEKFKQHVGELKSRILPTRISLKTYRLEAIPGIWNCKLCGFVADRTHPNVLVTHLWDKHKIKRSNGSFQVYLDTYFPTKSCSCGCGRAVRLAKRGFAFARFAPECDGLHRSRNPGCIDFYLYQGMEVDAAIENFRLRQRVVATKHSTESLRDKLSTINMGRNNPASLKSICRRTGKEIGLVRQELSEKSAGQNNGFYGKTHTNDVMSKIAKTRSRGSKYVTKPEMAVWGMLHALGANFEFEEPVDRYIVDFKIGNTIIEVFGDFWHNRQSKLCFSDKPEKDRVKIDRLQFLGYRTEIIWESEIFTTPDLVVARLRKIVDES